MWKGFHQAYSINSRQGHTSQALFIKQSYKTKTRLMKLSSGWGLYMVLTERAVNYAVRREFPIRFGKEILMKSVH